MAYLPAEIHQSVAPYLSNADLCNYRLANRMLGEIGTKFLFRTVAFHASSDGIDRLISISEHEQRSREVKALLWDTNMWNSHLQTEYEDQHRSRIRGPYSQGGESWFHEFHDYLLNNHYPIELRNPNQNHVISLTDRRNRPVIAPRISDQLGPQYAEYERRVADEKRARQTDLKCEHLSQLLEHFDNLEKFYTMNGDPEHWGEKLSKKHFRCGPPVPPDLLSRGERLHPRGDRRPEQCAGVFAFWTILAAFRPRPRKLRMDTLDLKAFVRPTRQMLRDPSHPLTRLYNDYNLNSEPIDLVADPLGDCIPNNPNAPGPCENLTSLKMTITTWDEDENSLWHDFPENQPPTRGTLRSFLEHLPNLQSLSLTAERPNVNDRHELSFYKVIPESQRDQCVWPCLRKLSLNGITIYHPEDFIDFLQAHKSTLEDLRLLHMELEGYTFAECESHSIRYENLEGVDSFDWRYVFHKLRTVLSLKKATFKGNLLQTVGYSKDGWNMDRGLSDALASYLVNGGTCPLNVGNALPSRKVGSEFSANLAANVLGVAEEEIETSS